MPLDSFQSSQQLNLALCEMLNIDPTGVNRIILESNVNEIARVTVYSYARTYGGKLNKFADIVKHYEIREVNG